MAKKNKRKNKAREPLEYEIPYEPEEVVEQPRTINRATLVYLIDQDEVNMLINASTAEFVEPIPPVEVIHQHSYTSEEANQLVNGEPIAARKSKKKK